MKKNNSDFTFISSKFDEEGVRAPESLNEANMAKKLEAPAQGNVIKFDNSRKVKRGAMRTAVALVACFAVVAVTLFAVDRNKSSYVPDPQTASLGISGIRSFASYDELTEELGELQERNALVRYGAETLAEGFTAVQNNVAKSAASDGDMKTSEEANVGGAEGGMEALEQTDASFAQTNKQVDAVDEPDIIKTDANYIYYMARYPDTLFIYSVDDGAYAEVAQISFNSDNPENEYEYVSEMYLDGNQLLIIGEHDRWYWDAVVKNEAEDADEDTETVDTEDSRERVDNYTFLRTYDITDRAHPQQVAEYRQSGRYVSSRMIGSTVYLISDYGTEYYILYGSEERKEEFVPCATDESGKVTKLPIENISAVEGFKDGNYSVIGAVDMAADGQSNETKALLGASSNVYCNEKNLYLTGYTYEETDKKNYVFDEYTQIMKYAVDGLDIKEQCAVKLKGNLNDQFSLDEYDGNLRVAVTEYDWNDDAHNRNYLYVFDENLKEIGKLDSFAAGEHIEAVRFMGDIAYVITYETTDPLFIIDLSEPTAPAMKGEVKIDGFSTFLTPVDENTMLGIGFATKEEDWGVVQDGLKLTLFDVSDMAQPKVLDAIEYHRGDSAAQRTHKAIVKNEDKGYFAIPFYLYDGYDAENELGNGALVIRVEDGHLAVENLDTGYWSERCTYVGDYVYVINEDGSNVHSFEVK